MATKKFLDSAGVSHLYARLKSVIESQTNDSVKSIANATQEGNVFTVVYTTVKGDEKSFTLTIPYASESTNGLMTATQVTRLAAKVDAIKINNTALTVVDGEASGTLSFGIVGDAIVLKIGETEIGSVDTTDFVVDGMLEDAEVVDGEDGVKTLRLQFNTDAGSKTVDVDVSDLVDTYALSAGAASTGDYVTLTPAVSGDGSTANPWKITVAVDETKLKSKLSGIDESISEINETIEGIVSVGGEANKVDDVTVDGASIVSDKVAKLVTASSAASGLMSKEQVATLEALNSKALTDITYSTAPNADTGVYVNIANTYADGSYKTSLIHVPLATSERDGSLSATDKAKLDTLEAMEALTEEEIDALLS